MLLSRSSPQIYTYHLKLTSFGSSKEVILPITTKTLSHQYRKSHQLKMVFNQGLQWTSPSWTKLLDSTLANVSPHPHEPPTQICGFTGQQQLKHWTINLALRHPLHPKTTMPRQPLPGPVHAMVGISAGRHQACGGQGREATKVKTPCYNSRDHGPSENKMASWTGTPRHHAVGCSMHRLLWQTYLYKVMIPRCILASVTWPWNVIQPLPCFASGENHPKWTH